MGELGILLGILGAVGAVAAIGAAVSSSSSASTSSSTCPTPPTLVGGAWNQATVMQQGDNVRISMDPQSFAQLAQSQGLTDDAAGWISLMSSGAVVSAFGTTAAGANAPVLCATVWGPNDALPDDWPSDDPDTTGGFHAQFTYGGSWALDSTHFPIPVTAWTYGVFGGQVPQGPTSGASSFSAAALRNIAKVITPAAGAGSSTTASTAPRTAHLVPIAAGASNVVNLTGVAPGTPIAASIDQGGTFTSIDAQTYGPDGSIYEESGYPLGTMPTLPFWVYTTTASAGQLVIGWTDANSGQPYTMVITYGP